MKYTGWKIAGIHHTNSTAILQLSGLISATAEYSGLASMVAF